MMCHQICLQALPRHQIILHNLKLRSQVVTFLTGLAEHLCPAIGPGGAIDSDMSLFLEWWRSIGLRLAMACIRTP